MQTFLGRAIDLKNFQAEDVYIKDIAHALSNICRYNGHTKFHYSVAQHSYLMWKYSKQFDRDLQLLVLLHDAHEAYLGDLTRPLKEVLKSTVFVESYDDLANRIQRKIHEKVEVTYDSDQKVLAKQIDNRILLNEKQETMNTQLYRWGVEEIYVMLEMKEIKKWSPKKAERKFLKAFDSLMNNHQN